MSTGQGVSTVSDTIRRLREVASLSERELDLIVDALVAENRQLRDALMRIKNGSLGNFFSGSDRSRCFGRYTVSGIADKRR